MRNGRGWRAVAAAALIAALVGGIAGWLAHGAAAVAQSGLKQFISEALNAHKLYVTEVRHPIEVRAGEEHLMPWLSLRVGTTLRAPNLETFSLKLLGGRLLPGLNGPAHFPHPGHPWPGQQWQSVVRGFPSERYSTPPTGPAGMLMQPWNPGTDQVPEPLT